MIISFISENEKKTQQYHALQTALASDLCTIAPKTLSLEEIQSVDGADVVRHKIEQAKKTTSLPCFVDDVSLSIMPGHYPGALIKHLLKTSAHGSLPQLLPENAPVTVTCHIGYFDGFETFFFKGEIQGVVSYERHDPKNPPALDHLIRINERFLGELDPTDNHRGKAFAFLANHLRQTKRLCEEHHEQAAQRWDARANNWASTREDEASYVHHENGYARFDDELSRILPLVSGTALDIGCGDGAVTRLIRTGSGITDILGIDISSQMIETATRLTNDDCIRYEVGTLPDNERIYNLIASRGVILSHTHRSEVIPLLSAMAKSLAPGGYLVFDYISNLANNDDLGRAEKNELRRNWIVRILSELGLVNISSNGSETHRVSVLTFHKPMETSLYFASSSAGKVIELQSKCKNHLLHLANIDVAELKHDDIVEIAKDKARKSYEALQHPVIVTDGGIFINALKGFPGPNSKQAATLLGPAKILKLLEGEMDRAAIRRNCMVYYDGTAFKTCVAEVPLMVSESVTDSEYKAYPLDTILVPVHEQNPLGKTYKQMPVEERVTFTELPFFEEFIGTL
jgi:non-canonical purine NTP pyrophosphatase (RdgB/HAM1 family)